MQKNCRRQVSSAYDIAADFNGFVYNWERKNVSGRKGFPAGIYAFCIFIRFSRTRLFDNYRIETGKNNKGNKGIKRLKRIQKDMD
jgi:hypothetical protein